MTYFRRLLEHPGLPWAIGLPVFGCFAGAGREDWLSGAFVGAFIMAAIVWPPVLLSNRRRP